MCVCMYVCMCVCMYVCMYLCMYVCLYVCMSVCLSVCMHECMRKNTGLQERPPLIVNTCTQQVDRDRLRERLERSGPRMYECV